MSVSSEAVRHFSTVHPRSNNKRNIKFSLVLTKNLLSDVNRPNNFKFAIIQLRDQEKVILSFNKQK